jgi:hypothetical protein
MSLAARLGDMNATMRRPESRTCERCGRRERWDDAESRWRVAADDDGRAVGNVYCVHEWDIDGTFAPFGYDEEA